MTFNHDHIRERLVDFLYGELDAEARAAFDAHLKGCDACRGEVAGAEQARGIGRAVARAPLGDAVPPGVRARAVAAAEAARESQSARKVPLGRGPSWFERLRGRWAFPTFATVAALAAFLLVRGTIFREAKQPLGERALDELAPKEVAAPSPPPARAVEAQAPSGARRPRVNGLFNSDPGESAAPSPGKDEAPREEGGTGSLGKGVSRGPAAAAERHAAKRAANRRDPQRDDGRQPLEREETSPAARPRGDAFGTAATPSPELDRLPRDMEKAEAPSTPGRAAQRRSAVESADKAAAAPPPYGGGSAGLRPPSQPEAESASGAASAAAADVPADARRRGFATPPAVVAPAAPAAAPATPTAAAAPPPDATRSSTAKKSKARASETPVSAPSGAPADPAAALAVRAEAAMAAHRWNEAATIYRQLLRAYPADVAAPGWRKKLAAAQAAIAADTGQFAAPPR